MKKISLLLALMIICISLFACTSGDPNLPKYDELCKIEIGMSMAEVEENFGKPQRRIIEFENSNEYRLYPVYDSRDGKSIGIIYKTEWEETPIGNTMEEVEEMRPFYSFVQEIISVEPDTRKRSDLPTYEELSQITEGMLCEDVIEKYGQAQRTIERNYTLSFNPQASSAITILSTYYVYDSCDGMSVAVHYSASSNDGSVESIGPLRVSAIITVSPDDR